MAEPHEQPPVASGSESPQAMEVDGIEAPVNNEPVRNPDDDASTEGEATAAAAAINNPIATQLAHFHAQLNRIEELERRMENRVKATRRRTAALMVDQWGQTTRSSHLRLYLSHSYAPEITPAGAMAALMKQQSPGGSNVSIKPRPPCWTLHIEGKLLVDHLDHAAAADFDRRHGYAAPNDDLDRSRGEEEDAPDLKQPLRPTHFFDKVKVTFQTVYAPMAVSSKKAATATPPKKKSSRRSSSSGSPVPEPPLPEIGEERILSLKHQVVWNRAEMSGDPTEDSADIWSFPYYEPPPPVPHKEKWKAVSVTAYVELYRRPSSSYVTAVSSLYPQPVEQHVVEHTVSRYRILSHQLQSTLFPHHGPETIDLLTGKKRNSSNGSDEATTTTTSANAAAANADSTSNLEVPLHNEVHVQHTLTMAEIANAFFTYIRDRRLVSTQDVVQADELLQQLLGMEQFSFSQLQQLLQQQRLIEVVSSRDGEPPIQITYILESDAASVLGLPEPAGDADGAGAVASESHNHNNNYSLLQFDLDVIVPALAPYRCRELLRRVKRRELEYTSSRPKARYLLPNLVSASSSASGTNANINTTSTKEDDERWVRQQMDRAAAQEDVHDPLLIPLQLALAKAAPPHSEARQSLYLDAATAHVLQELRTRLAATTTTSMESSAAGTAAAWPTLEACHAWLLRASHRDDDK